VRLKYNGQSEAFIGWLPPYGKKVNPGDIIEIPDENIENKQLKDGIIRGIFTVLDYDMDNYQYLIQDEAFRIFNKKHKDTITGFWISDFDATSCKVYTGTCVDDTGTLMLSLERDTTIFIDGESHNRAPGVDLSPNQWYAIYIWGDEYPTRKLYIHYLVPNEQIVSPEPGLLKYKRFIGILRTDYTGKLFPYWMVGRTNNRKYYWMADRYTVLRVASNLHTSNWREISLDRFVPPLGHPDIPVELEIAGKYNSNSTFYIRPKGYPSGYYYNRSRYGGTPATTVFVIRSTFTEPPTIEVRRGRMFISVVGFEVEY